MLCVCVCSLLTKAFRTARALSAGDVGAGQYWTLLPLTLSHTMLRRIREEHGGVGEKRQKTEAKVKETQGGVTGCTISQWEMRRDTQRIFMPDHKDPSTVTGMSGCEEVQTTALLD